MILGIIITGNNELIGRDKGMIIRNKNVALSENQFKDYFRPSSLQIR